MARGVGVRKFGRLGYGCRFKGEPGRSVAGVACR